MRASWGALSARSFASRLSASFNCCICNHDKLLLPVLLKLRLWKSEERSSVSSSLDADLVCSDLLSVEVGVASDPPMVAMMRVVSVCDLCLPRVPPRLPGSGEGDGDGERRDPTPGSPGVPPTLPDMRLTSRGDSSPALACPRVSRELRRWMEGEGGG